MKFRLFSKKKLLKHWVLYKGIEDLPIWNWSQIHETGNLKLLVKEGEFDNEGVLGELWMSIYQEYLDEFGIHDDFKTYISKQKELGIKVAELIETGDKFKKVEIEIIKRDLEMLSSEKEKQRFEEVVWGLRKFSNVNFDPKVVTVKEYYSLIEYMKKSVGNGKENNK